MCHRKPLSRFSGTRVTSDMSFFARRKTRKIAKELLASSRHARMMREDVVDQTLLDDALAHEQAVKTALKSGDTATLENAMIALNERVGKVQPRPKSPGLKENVEILVIALAVAIGFRTYFLQPFRIPTGSMQPTLYGITYVGLEEGAEPGVLDTTPLKWVKFILTGNRYQAVHAPAAGEIFLDESEGLDIANRITLRIGTTTFKVHNGMLPYFKMTVGKMRRNPLTGEYVVTSPGDRVEKDQLLVECIHRTGDQLFVDRVRWNFMRPERGQVMVFRTDDIEALMSAHRGDHYIKRLVGMPGDSIEIREPELVINGSVVTEPESIVRIQERGEGHNPSERYLGYIGRGAFDRPGFTHRIADDGYFACGDNQGSSHDSRYWGEVPEDHMVGPAVFVYWPFTERWGRIK